MAQISLYIEDSMAELLSAAAKSENCSVSKYVAAIISERLFERDAEEERKAAALRGLEGSINDWSFMMPSDIPMAAEKSRRYDLL